MKTFAFTILRVIALAIIYTVLFTVASSLTTPRVLAQRFTPEQMAQASAALPVVSLIITIMLVYLALRSRWHGWKLAGALFVIPYSLFTFLGQIELLAFPAVSSQMPEGMIRGSFIAGLIVTIPFALCTVWVLGKNHANSQGTLSEHLQMPASEWTWKVAVGAILYVIVYFTFGYYVAWRTPGLPEFYGGTDPGTFLGQMANVMRDTPWLPVLQFFRGLIWVGIGCIVIRMHKGSALETILATGLAFTVLMNVALIFPNPFMPPAIVRAHAIELVSSNLLYGILLSVLMLWKSEGQRSKQPGGLALSMK
jgi:hypothetical protein